MGVRRATEKDMLVLEELCDEFWRTYHHDCPYDPDYFLALLKQSLDDETFLILLLNDTEGMFLGAISQTNFSCDPAAREMVWYTRPSARGRGMKLYRYFESWARKQGAKHIVCGLNEPSPVMERLGFKLLGVEYIRAVDR